jgi:hypothetical protein
MKKLIFCILLLSAMLTNAQFKILSNGNVGINTVTPLTIFQIYNDFKKVSFGSATSLTDGISYQGFNAVRQSNGNWLTHNNGTKNGGFILYSDLNGNLNLVSVSNTGSTNQSFSDPYLTNNTIAKFGPVCYIATGTNSPPSGVRNYFKGWKTVLDNGLYATTLYIELANADPRIYSTRNGISGEPQIVFYNSNTGSYEDIKARSFIQASDASLKNNVNEIVNASEKIKALHPISFNWVGQANNAPKSYGFIAQEIEQIIPDIVFTDDTSHLKSVNYISIIPYLVKAFQEQIQIIKEQEEKINMLKDELANCCSTDKTKNMMLNNSKTNNNDNTEKTIGAYLMQNAPNPFTAKTTIRFYIPEQTNNASILIFDMQGKLLKTYPINTKKEGSIEINGGEMQPGMYLYSLIIDGKEIDTKRMILTE